MSGNIRIVALFLVLTAIFAAFGWLLGSLMWGEYWIYSLIFFLVLALLMNAIGYFLADRIVLWSYRVRIVNENEAPRLYRTVRRISQIYGLPMPRVGIIPTDTANAFATGRNPKKAVVAATEGILSLLNDEELDGVIAHEMGHVKDRDVLVMTVAATLAAAISFLARAFFWNMWFGGAKRGREGNGLMWIIAIIGLILVPIAALLLQLAISRGREYKADYVGATTIGKPLGLASALEKLEASNRRRPLRFGSPATANLFIVNPFSGASLMRILSTHPPIKERVKRLREMAWGKGFVTA